MKIKEVFDKKRNLIIFNITYKFSNDKESIRNVVFEEDKITKNQDNFIIKTHEEEESEDEISIYSDDVNSSQQSYNSIFDSDENDESNMKKFQKKRNQKIQKIHQKHQIHIVML